MTVHETRQTIRTDRITVTGITDDARVAYELWALEQNYKRTLLVSKSSGWEMCFERREVIE